LPPRYFAAKDVVGMKAHLLNWTLGPALLSAIFAASGADPPAAPASQILLGLPSVFVGFAGFFGTFYLIFLLLRIIAHRLNERRFVWTEIRVGATVMAIQLVLLVVTFSVLFTIHQLAVIVTGGWPKGWQAAAGGAGVGAAVGLPMGIGVALLQLPKRLGLEEFSERKAVVSEGSDAA